MISVIIPTCDRPIEFLMEAINSVLGQSLSPAEVIVVDNGSCDVDSAALPEGVTLYRLPPRVGPSRARNFGAAMATGTHLAFLDDDDWWDSDFLLEAWTVLEGESARCVYGRKDIHYQTGTERYKCPTPDTLTVQVLLKRNPGTGGQNLLIEKVLFWRIAGFDDSLHTSEDKALALEVLLCSESIAIAPDAVTVVRSHDGPRARQAVWHKLRFAWKYRNLHGIGGLMCETLRVVVRQTRTGLHQLLSRSNR